MSKSNETTPNVPTLRFKRYTTEWTKINLSNYLFVSSKRNKDGRFSKEDVLSVSGELGIVNQIALLGRSYAGESVLPYHIVEKGDIVYTKSPLALYPYGIIKTNRNKVGIVSTLYAVYKTKDNANNRFIEHYFSLKSRINNYLKPIVRIGAKHDMKIGNNEVLENIVAFPDISEQCEIADFLDLLDNRISVQNKIISKYETLIKGISNLLLCKIEDCPTIKLSDILIEYNDKARQNNEYPILSSTMNGIFVQSEYFNKQAASEETVGYKKVPYGYCTYRSMSDTGEFRFNIQKIVEIGIVSPAYPVFTSVEYDMRFIAFYLNNSTRLRKQILEIKEGGTRFALPFSKLRNLTIPKITRLQQTKIVDIYCLFSRKKELEQRFLLKLKEQKDYLLSKMFI